MIYLQIPSNAFMGALKEDWAILVMFLIISVYQIIKIYLDQKKYRKVKEYELKRESLDKHRESVMESIERYLKILSDKYTEEVTDIQMPVIVTEFVGHVKEAITVEAAASIARNNIKSYKKETEAKLEQFIVNRFKDLIVNLGRFKWRGYYMSEFVELEIKRSIIATTLSIVVRERDTADQTLEAYRQLGSSMDQKFDQLKTSILSKAYDR